MSIVSPSALPSRGTALAPALDAVPYRASRSGGSKDSNRRRGASVLGHDSRGGGGPQSASAGGDERAGGGEGGRKRWRGRGDGALWGEAPGAGAHRLRGAFARREPVPTGVVVAHAGARRPVALVVPTGFAVPARGATPGSNC